MGSSIDMNHQTTLFDHLYPTFRFSRDKPIRVVELFSGIGFQAMGIELAEIPYEVVATSEIDKYAIKSYEAIHGHNPNLGSITDINGSDIPIDVDIMTYSFPCTDLSKAGKQKGLDNTRSGLVYEVLRILAELKDLDNLPKVLIMENVVDLIQSKFIKQFNEIQLELEQLGYMNYVETLNAKNYGIAQNRDRVFMVSILGEYNYNFPKPFELEYRLKDYLESNVDEKYYLSDKQMSFVRTTSFRSMGVESIHNGDDIASTLTTMQGGNREPKIFEPMIGYALNSREFEARGWMKDIAPTLCARDYKDPKVVLEPQCLNSKVIGKQHSLQDKIYDSDSIATAITTSFHPSYTEPLLIPEATEKGYSEAYEGDLVNLEHPNSKTRRGRVGKGVDNALTTSCNQGVVEADGLYLNDSEKFHKGPIKGLSRTLKANKHDAGVVENQLRIRKLTPRECMRLMGANDEQIEKQLEVVSNSQAYKQAGNGIVATVIGLIVGMMYYDDELELRRIVMNNSHRWIR